MEVVDSRIDLNGDILISKEALRGETTVPIDLQWMVMTCDPESVTRETCDELPEREKPQQPKCTQTCPAGPPGNNGRPVIN